ncbi:hypothetical protein [Lutibacter citreus]|uniref:hypothetical protein n=1 Tax=Lutibacter citreus TaxID=2138210 RepID=UPI000DBE8455|nr:hypothetical protein [Lutibacter citreus]
MILLLLCISCSTTKNISKNELESYDVLNSITQKQKSGKIYYLTINNMYDKTDLSKYINPKFLDFPLCINNSINPANIFEESDFEYIKKQFNELQIIKIRKPLIKHKSAITKIKGKNETSFMTFPIVFKNGNYAIYYSESRYGGEFSLLKKEGEKWEKICSTLLWIE